MLTLLRLVEAGNADGVRDVLAALFAPIPYTSAAEALENYFQSVVWREDVSRNTASAYMGSLRRLYLFEDLPSWRPSLRDRAWVTATPKRHFVDPSLAAAALGATPQNLLRDLPTLG